MKKLAIAVVAAVRRARVAPQVAAAFALLGVLLVGGATASAAPSAAPFDVRDAVAQFRALKHHGEAVGWVLPESQGAPDPSNDDHYQGVARYPGEGAPLLYVTQRDNDDAVVAPGTDPGGYLLVARMGTRPPTGERMRSNLQSRAGTPTRSIRARPTRGSGRSASTARSSQEGRPAPAYEHPGGMAVVDDVLLMALDTPRAAGSPTAQLLLFDLRPDPASPRAIRALPLTHKIDNLGAIRRADGTLLLWVNGDGGHVTRFYATSTADLRDPALHLTLLQTWDPSSPDDFGSVASPECEGSDWPMDTDAYQGSAFVRQADGRLFLVMTRNTSGNPVLPDCDLADLYSVDPKPSGGFRLVRVASDHLFCNYDGAGRICNLAAAANAYVSPSGELMLYSLPHDDQDGFDPDYVRMAEFRHRDVSTEDSPLRLPSVDAGGPYTADEGGSVQLSGAGGPITGPPWVELYGDDHFLGRSSSSTSTTAACSSSRTSTTSTASTTRRAPCGGGRRPASTSSCSSTTTSAATSSSCPARGTPRRSPISRMSTSATRHRLCAGWEPSRPRARSSLPGISTATARSTIRAPPRPRSELRLRTGSSRSGCGSRTVRARRESTPRR